MAALLLGAFLSSRPAWPDPAPEQVRKSLAGAAARQVGVTTLYDPSYVRLAYPNGDVPADRGVCTDVVVRAFRAIGVDLQVEVHEDMKKSFSAYPRTWGMKRPDRNIDHRWVPNLLKYFVGIEELQHKPHVSGRRGLSLWSQLPREMA